MQVGGQRSNLRETATVAALDIAMTGTSSDDSDDGQQDAQTRHRLDHATEARLPATKAHIAGLFARLAKAQNGRILSSSESNYLDHPAGGCRMGTDPTSSVCDSFGRTHDHDNLFVVGAPTLAGIASSIGSGLLSDYIGRKKVLIVLAALYTVSSIAAAIAPNYETLVAARFIGGFAFASLGIAPMYIAEIAPAEKRGLLVSFNQFNIMIGFSAAYFANYFLLHASQDGTAWVQALGIDRHIVADATHIAADRASTEIVEGWPPIIWLRFRRALENLEDGL